VVASSSVNPVVVVVGKEIRGRKGEGKGSVRLLRDEKKAVSTQREEGEGGKEKSATYDFPTPESPIRTTYSP
jgi:hypothetical protein